MLYGGGAETLGVEKNTDLKNLDWRIFASFGLGGNFGYRWTYCFIPKTKSGYYNESLTEYLAGAEFIFNNGQGFNMYGNAEVIDRNSNIATIGANYIYESRSAIKWAVLTGLDTGTELGGLSKINAYILRYNLGVRLRKNRHAISLNIKIPLFESPIYRDFPDLGIYDLKMKVYTGVVPTIRYTYFFGL